MKFLSHKCKLCNKKVKYLINHIVKNHFQETQHLRNNKDGWINAVQNKFFEDDEK